MLRICREFKNLNFSELMGVYSEENIQTGITRYPYLPTNEQILRVEQDNFDFLRDFLRDQDTFYALWVEKQRYVSALRIERYADGFLLSGLITAPECRNRGYAKALIMEVLSYITANYRLPVYSHVGKSNIASISAHKACGFVCIKDVAAFIDGSVSHDSCTLCYRVN